MSFSSRWFAYVLGACGCLWSGDAAAQDWSGLVVGDTGQGAGRAFADSYYAARALEDFGGAPVTLLRNASYDAVSAGFDDLSGKTQVAFYFAGPLEGGMQVDGRKFEISSGIARLQSAGLKHVLLMFENCAGDAQTAAPLPEIGEGASDLSVVVLASAGAAQACPPAGERLSDTLKQVGKAEALMVPELASYVQQGELDDLPDQPRPQTDVIASTPARRDQVLITDVVRVIPASAPAGLTPVSVPAVSAQRRPERSDASAPVVIFSPVSNPQLAALPQADGLPEPSIIVGLIEGADQNFDAALDPSDLSGNEISYDNVEARLRLMRQDPDLYAGLLASGAFDPPGPLLVRALQQELARMGCYTSRVDGAWGPGSQRAVVRYYDEAGVQVPTQAAEVSLYRDIIGREDVTCTAPVAAAPQPRRNTSPAPTTRRPAAQPTAPRAPAQTQIAPGAALGGVFR